MKLLSLDSNLLSFQMMMRMKRKILTTSLLHLLLLLGALQAFVLASHNRLLELLAAQLDSKATTPLSRLLSPTVLTPTTVNAPVRAEMFREYLFRIRLRLLLLLVLEGTVLVHPMTIQSIPQAGSTFQSTPTSPKLPIQSPKPS